MSNIELTREKVKNALVNAASQFRKDQKLAYLKAIRKESVPSARWVLERILENALTAETNHSTFCDDTGIPHLIIEIGENNQITSQMMDAIQQGVALGLRSLPGRPMAVKGNDIQRIDQTGGLDEDPGALLPAPIRIKRITGNGCKLHILLLGGGPEIRAITHRVYHEHRIASIMDQIVDWGITEASQLGCTPCVPAIGIGRTHFEATSLVLEAMVHGNFSKQSELEQEITNRINKSNIGPLGLSGSTTALATFIKIGPQRASGVRIVSMRLCCCIEPRVASIDLYL